MGSGCQGRKVSMVQEVQGVMCVGGRGARGIMGVRDL